MPTIVWLIAGASVWLATVGATCALLTMNKRGSCREGLPNNDAPGLVEPGISAIAINRREPRLARRTNAFAPGGPDQRRARHAPGSVDVDQSTPANSYALHLRGEMVARLRWCTGPGRPAGWYLWQRRGGWRHLE